MKNKYGNKSKAKSSMPASTKNSEIFDKAKKNKKGKQHKNKQDFTNLAIGVNMTKVGDKKKRKKDVSEIICYNCNKKKHYITKCLESQKSKN